jgi:hypothetical protein
MYVLAVRQASALPSIFFRFIVAKKNHLAVVRLSILLVEVAKYLHFYQFFFFKLALIGKKIALQWGTD